MAGPSPPLSPPPATRRLFFALWPDDGLRRRLARATRSAVAAAGGQAVAPGNFHLTLAFLGAVPGDRIPDLIAAAGTAAPATTPLVMDRYGSFPRARVFWIGPTVTPPDLRALVSALWSAVARLGLPLPRDADPTGEAYQPHLTLCRKVLRQPPVPPPEPLLWVPAGFVLAASGPAPGGARYQVLARFPPSC